MQQPGLNIGYLAFNTQKKPFDRQAGAPWRSIMAIDKKAILEAVYHGAGEPAKNLIPPTMWSYNDNMQDFPTIRKRPRSCSPRPASRTGSRPISGPCRCSAPTTPMPGASPS